MLYFALSDPGSSENGIYRIGLSGKDGKKIYTGPILRHYNSQILLTYYKRGLHLWKPPFIVC
jgi:hypothetical protein